MMEATYPAYDCYKESGVQWWPSIPSHWSIKTLKHALRIYNGQDHKDVLADEGYPVYGSGGQFAFASAYLHDGEAILLGRKGTIDRPIHVMGKFWSVDTMFYAICNSTFLPRFAYYYCTTIPFSYFSTATALPSMTQSDLKNNRIAFPPLSEQRAIAAFLDDKCAKIDGAVKIKEDQIALLRERRQIIIQDAVTRGLNPAAPMKDSGIDWIGQIPAHWEVKRNKHMFVEINQRSAKGTEQHLSMSQKLGLVPANLVEKALVSESYEGAKLVQPGDLVLNRLKAHLAVFSIAQMEGLVSPDYSVFHPFVKGASSQYYEALFKTSMFLGEFRLRVRGIVEGFYRLYTDSFMDIPLLIPPQAEQDDIVAHLDQLAIKFDAAVSIKQDQIAALKEYKTSLINAAVTGKIKVI